MSKKQKQADEYAVFSKRNNVLRYKAKVVAAIKKRVRKKDRKDSKDQIRKDPEGA